eukprot:8085772-Pyramimonas_sp.AAC.2
MGNSECWWHDRNDAGRTDGLNDACIVRDGMAATRRGAAVLFPTRDRLRDLDCVSRLSSTRVKKIRTKCLSVSALLQVGDVFEGGVVRCCDDCIEHRFVKQLALS